MQSKLTAPFLLFGFALLLWSGAAALSLSLAGGAAGPAHPTGGHAAEDTAEIRELRAKAAGAPNSVELHLTLAGALHEEAVAKHDNGLLMDAVQEYQKVLELSAEHPDALLGLATLCFEAGILDKALDYYRRYLVGHPDDLKTKTDFGLAQLQANMLDDAEKTLQEVISKKPDLYQAHLSLALVWKVQGKTEQAAKKADEAKKLAPTDEDRARIEQFLKAFAESGAGGSPTGASAGMPGMDAPPQDSKDVSPSMQVNAYFQNHPIIGPKLKGITWPELNVAKVSVENFPVEQMPPFAKQKFVTSTQTKFQNFPDKTELKLVDFATGRELMSIIVGGGAAN